MKWKKGEQHGVEERKEQERKEEIEGNKVCMVARCSTRRNKRRTTHNSGTIGKTIWKNKKVWSSGNSKEKGKKERGSKGRRKWNKGARTMAEKKRREI